MDAAVGTETVSEKQALYEQVVESLDTLFGHHSGCRPVHG